MNLHDKYDVRISEPFPSGAYMENCYPGQYNEEMLFLHLQSCHLNITVLSIKIKNDIKIDFKTKKDNSQKSFFHQIHPSVDKHRLFQLQKIISDNDIKLC